MGLLSVVQPPISTNALPSRSNILNEEEPSASQAQIWFECVVLLSPSHRRSRITIHREIKPLQQVSIRGSGPLLEGGAGFRAVRDEEGKVQSVEPDGVRILVGEDVPEGCGQ